MDIVFLDHFLSTIPASKMIGNVPATSTGYFSNSTSSFVTNCIEMILVCNDASVYKSHMLHGFFSFRVYLLDSTKMLM